jgi:hypothetical protein
MLIEDQAEVLFILNDPPCGSERTYQAVCLAATHSVFGAWT